MAFSAADYLVMLEMDKDDPQYDERLERAVAEKKRDPAAFEEAAKWATVAYKAKGRKGARTTSAATTTPSANHPPVQILGHKQPEEGFGSLPNTPQGLVEAKAQAASEFDAMTREGRLQWSSKERYIGYRAYVLVGLMKIF